jgi:hypothetical protein
MLATTRSCGQAASTSASMRSLPVVKAPALPCRRAISSALVKTVSAGVGLDLEVRAGAPASRETRRGRRATAHAQVQRRLRQQVGRHRRGDEHEQRDQQLVHAEAPRAAPSRAMLASSTPPTPSVVALVGACRRM